MSERGQRGFGVTRARVTEGSGSGLLRLGSTIAVVVAAVVVAAVVVVAIIDVVVVIMVIG